VLVVVTGTSVPLSSYREVPLSPLKVRFHYLLRGSTLALALALPLGVLEHQTSRPLEVKVPLSNNSLFPPVSLYCSLLTETSYWLAALAPYSDESLQSLRGGVKELGK
jgi:hypothetical protein